MSAGKWTVSSNLPMNEAKTSVRFKPDKRSRVAIYQKRPRASGPYYEATASLPEESISTGDIFLQQAGTPTAGLRICRHMTTKRRAALDKWRKASGRHPTATFFVLTFAISWTAAFAVAAPHLARREPLTHLTGILMFPAMLLGPSVSGLGLSALIEGKAGLQELGSRMARWRFGVGWYPALFIPPALVLGVLLTLKVWVSSAYTPNFFLMGVLFGVPAGFFEEIGWTGFAFEKMSTSGSDILGVGIRLGLLWTAWHIPVINYLGTATPHGSYWFPFLAAFGVAMTAMRVLICWLYSKTRSLLLAQLMHVSSTGSLVIFSPPRANAAQEVIWYGIYGLALWMVVTAVYAVFGKKLRRQAAS